MVELLFEGSNQGTKYQLLGEGEDATWTPVRRTGCMLRNNMTKVNNWIEKERKRERNGE